MWIVSLSCSPNPRILSFQVTISPASCSIQGVRSLFNIGQVALEGEATADLQAISRTAKHRLDRGIWTSTGAGWRVSPTSLILLWSSNENLTVSSCKFLVPTEIILRSGASSALLLADNCSEKRLLSVRVQVSGKVTIMLCRGYEEGVGSIRANLYVGWRFVPLGKTGSCSPSIAYWKIWASCLRNGSIHGVLSL